MVKWRSPCRPRRAARAAAVLVALAGLDLIGEVAGLDGQCRRVCRQRAGGNRN